jgi:ribosome maturation factor RimP
MRKAIALLLMLLMNLPAMSGTNAGLPEPAQSEKELKRQALFREKVESFGSGAAIRVVMRGSSAKAEYVGEIDEISADNFKLKTKDHNLTVRYDQVEMLSLKQRSYKTGGQPDPVQVRRVACDIGIGNKAKGELTTLKRFSGTIQSMEKEDFVINANGNLQTIKFNDVKRIEKGQMPAWGKALLFVGIAVAVVVVLTGVGVALED